MAPIILLVDSRDLMLKQSGRILREAGYEVSEAENGASAVRLALGVSRLWAALSRVNQAIFQMSTQHGLFRRVCQVLVQDGGFNLAWIGWHDAATQEITMMHPRDFFRAEDHALLEQRIGDVFRLGELTIQASFLSKCGELTPYFFTGRRAVYNRARCLVGVGIDVSERRKRAWTASTKGPTLGLAICRKLASLMGGDISAVAQCSRGSEFSLTLPLKKPSPP